jgi:hypothetical protein
MDPSLCRFQQMCALKHNRIFLAVMLLLGMIAPSSQRAFHARDMPPAGIYCSPYNDLTRLAFRRVQNTILTHGWEATFTLWDGIDDSVPDQFLSWKEMRQGLKIMVMYDNWGNPVSLTPSEIEMLLREFNDDDTLDFQVHFLPLCLRRWIIVSFSRFSPFLGMRRDAVA